jgi:hypothetical protein
MPPRTELKLSKKLIFTLAILVLLAIGIFLYSKHNQKTPLPPDLKRHVNFKVIYPRTTRVKIEPTSYVYRSQQKILTYKASYGGTTVVFTQQPAPPNIGTDTQAYYPALGVHPYAQFTTDLGQVALTKFYQSGNLKLFSQSAVMVSQGTLLTASSEKPLTNEQWKELFSSLKITG